MVIFLLYLLYILIGLLALIIILLALPWRLGFRGTIKSAANDFAISGAGTAGGTSFGLSMTFLPARKIQFGPYRQPWFGLTICKDADHPVKKSKAEKRAKKKKKSTGMLAQVDQAKAVMGAGVHRIHFNHLAVTGRVGFQNPMQTGLAAGFIQWLKLILPDRAKVEITPVFVNGGTDLEASFALRFSPACLALSAGIAYIRARKK